MNTCIKSALHEFVSVLPECERGAFKVVLTGDVGVTTMHGGRLRGNNLGPNALT